MEQDPNYFEKIKKRVGDFNKNFEPKTLFDAQPEALHIARVSGQVCEHPYHLVEERLNGKVKWCFNCNSEF